jgi:hypothetical protein
VLGDQLGGCHGRCPKCTAQRRRDTGWEVAALVQHLPRQVPDVELVAVAETVEPGLGRVVQERFGGEVGERDALAGQRAGDVEASTALVVRRGVLRFHEPDELVQLRIGLCRLEVLVVTDEVVAAKRN